MTHGYMLAGSGSNVYVQNLCRALVSRGHEVHLLCQESHPLEYDFVEAQYTVGPDGVRLKATQNTSYKGRCAVYRPAIGDLLPVYVYDDYPGWRVKTFLNLTDEELEAYIQSNVRATRLLLEYSGAEAIVTNHSVPGPLVARRALHDSGVHDSGVHDSGVHDSGVHDSGVHDSGVHDSGVPYVSIVHGSALQYVARKSKFYMEMAREGLAGARRILSPSSHSTRTVEEDFPELSERAATITGGVDTDLFRPDALDTGSVIDALGGGPGRGPKQAEALKKVLESVVSVDDLGFGLRSISSAYEARAHDRDAGHRLAAFLQRSGPLVVYVGKLIHSKGVHSLLSSFVQVHNETGARLLVIGFGTFREGLESLVNALSSGDRRTFGLLAESGQLLEGGPKSPLEHFGLPEDLVRDAAGIEEYVEFIGPLSHRELAKLLPAADAAVVPSIFPESFGLVAAELAASGVPPFVADHSGLREAGGIVGEGLPFDLRVSMKNSETLARSLTGYLGLTEEEKRESRETVRRNSVERLSWATLADQVVTLAANAQNNLQ